MISFGVALVAPVVMALWLASNGAKVSVFGAASTVYVQRVYRQWCAEQQRSPGWIRWVMPFIFVNWLVSFAAVIVLALM
jgi:hypothetical protein